MYRARVRIDGGRTGAEARVSFSAHSQPPPERFTRRRRLYIYNIITHGVLNIQLSKHTVRIRVESNVHKSQNILLYICIYTHTRVRINGLIPVNERR